VVLLVTGLVVAALGGVFAVTQWDTADRLATVLSALAAVAAVGISVWAALPAAGRGTSVRVVGSGKAVAGAGGTAVTGASGPAGSAPHQVDVQNTGDADASNGGDATSGARWD
jgi:hypothetical protein